MAKQTKAVEILMSELKEDVISAFLVIMGSPFIARFSGHRLVAEFDEVKTLLKVEDKHLCAKLHHLDSHLASLNYPIVSGFKVRGWKSMFQVEPMAQMYHSDIESQFLFQILDVDVRVDKDTKVLFCNIRCMRVHAFSLW